MQSNSAVSVCLCPWEVPFPALLVVWGLCLAGCVQSCCHPATALPGTRGACSLLQGQFSEAGAAVVGWDVPLG